MNDGQKMPATDFDFRKEEEVLVIKRTTRNNFFSGLIDDLLQICYLILMAFYFVGVGDREIRERERECNP